MSTGAGGWIATHKPLVLGVGAATILGLLFLHRRAGVNASNRADTTGSTAGPVTDGSGQYLVPYTGNYLPDENALATTLQRLIPSGNTTTNVYNVTNRPAPSPPTRHPTLHPRSVQAFQPRPPTRPPSRPWPRSLPTPVVHPVMNRNPATGTISRLRALPGGGTGPIVYRP